MSAIGPGVCLKRWRLVLSDPPVASARRLMAFLVGWSASTQGDVGLAAGVPRRM
jgi:hypothetical protein